MIDMITVKNYLMDHGKTVLDDMWGPTSINCINGSSTCMLAMSALYEPGSNDYQLAKKIVEIMGDKKYFAFYKLVEEENKIRFAAL